MLSLIVILSLGSKSISSNNSLLDNNYSSIFQLLLSFHATSIILDELICNSDSYRLKYEMFYDLFTIFPEQATNFISQEINVILYYDLLDELVKEKQEQSGLKDLIINKNNSFAEKQILNFIFNSKLNEEFNVLKGKHPFSMGNSLLELGLFVILISLFFKLALSPFHLWSPDIYEGSPSSTTFFFTVISKLSIFIFLLKIC